MFRIAAFIVLGTLIASGLQSKASAQPMIFIGETPLIHPITGPSMSRFNPGNPKNNPYSGGRWIDKAGWDGNQQIPFNQTNKQFQDYWKKRGDYQRSYFPNRGQM
jgi:hypothetical protein